MPQTNQSPENTVRADMLKAMKENVAEFKPDPISDEHLMIIILNSVPLLSGLLNSVSGTGKSLINLAQNIKSTLQGVAVAGKVLGTVGVVADGLNFIRIPAIYLACYLLGIKPPFTLSNNLKLLYAAVILSLGIAGIFVAPSIGLTLVATAIGLGTFYNIFLFVKTSYDRYRLGKEIKDLDKQIAHGYIELENIKKIAAGLDEGSEDVDALYKEYEKKSEKMQEWVNLKNEKQLERSRKNMLAIMDEGVIAGLSILAAVGVGLFLINPVMGLTVLSGAGVVGLTYVLGRMVTKAIYDYFNPEKSKDENKLLEIGSDDSLEHAARFEDKPVLDSGLEFQEVPKTQNNILASLGAPHPEFNDKNTLVDHFTKEIRHSINQHDSPKHILLLFKEMALATEKYHTDDEFIKEIFKDIPEWPEKGAIMLNDALNQAAELLTDDEQLALVSSRSLGDALLEYKIDLNRISELSVKTGSQSKESIEIKPAKSAPAPSDLP